MNSCIENSSAPLFRPDLQGLRAISILLVISAHGGVPNLQGGFVGVDVFFVLSGYLISSLLIRDHDMHGHIELASFFAGRLKRLLPALSAMLVGVALVAPFLLSVREMNEQTLSLPYAATWVSNFYFSFVNVNYFAELQQKDLFLHTWSLGVEEQFNLIWPFVILLSLRKTTPSRVPLTNRLGLVIALVFTCSLIFSWWAAGSHASIAYYLLPTRIWQFAFGGLILLVMGKVEQQKRSHLKSRSPKLSYVCLYVGMTLIVVTAIYMGDHVPYSGLLALAPSLGAGLVIAAGEENANYGRSNFLHAPILVWLGNRSYSWYLWHWPIFMIGFGWGFRGNYRMILVLTLTSLFVATLSYKYVELPFWKGRFSHGIESHVFAISFIAMLLPIAVLWNYPNSSGNTIAASDSAPIKQAHIAQNDLPSIYSRGCDSASRSAEVNPCVLGSAAAKKTAVLMGDSIGAQWTSMLSLIFGTPDWRLVVLTKSSCPMVDNDIVRSNGSVFAICREWRDNAIVHLASMKPDIVFIGSASTYGFNKKQWVEGTSSVIQRISLLTPRVVVIAGTPKLTFDGPGCLEKNAEEATKGSELGHRNCDEPLTSTQFDDVARYLKLATKKFSAAKVLDLNDLVCPGRMCYSRSPRGQITFRDSQHLTDTFVRSQSQIAADRIKSLFGAELLGSNGRPAENADQPRLSQPK